MTEKDNTSEPETATALAPVAIDVQGTHIEQYGGREEVRELVERLLFLHPAAADVGRVGMWAVAQLAVLSGASPLPQTNEIHVWKNNKGVIQTTLGINYFRRRAQQMGGIFWKIRPQQMNVKERTEYIIPEGVVAAICEGVRVEDMLRFKELGFTPIEVYQSVGQVGIGTVVAGDYAKKNRPIIWTALKAAEIDLYRKLFPMLIDIQPPATVTQAQTDPPPEPVADDTEAIQDGEVIQVGAEDTGHPNGCTPPFLPGTEPAIAAEPPAGEPPAGEPPTPATPAGEPDLIPADGLKGPAHALRKQLMDRSEQISSEYTGGLHADRAEAPATGRQAQFIASMFTEAFAPDTNARKEYHSALRWLWGVDSATKLSFCQARATLAWLVAGQDPDTNEYMLNDGVCASARLILRHVMIKKGQRDMFEEEE